MLRRTRRIELHRGDAEAAHRFLVEALEAASRIRFGDCQRYALAPIAAAVAFIDPPRGATLLGAVEASNRQDGRALSAPVAEVVEQATAALRESLGDDELAAARRRGTALTFDEVVELALQRDGTSG